MDPHYQQSRLPLSLLLVSPPPLPPPLHTHQQLQAQYLTTHSRNQTSSPPELFLSIPSIDYSNIYCPSCSLPGPCLCSTVANNLQSSYLDFSPSNTNSPVNSTFNGFDISAYINTPDQSAHSTPSMSFSASAPSSPMPNGETAAERDEWSHVMRDRRRRSGVMSTEEAREVSSLLFPSLNCLSLSSFASVSYTSFKLHSLNFDSPPPSSTRPSSGMRREKRKKS
jgi:hypothetical protein